MKSVLKVNQIQILLVDDHKLFRTALANLLNLFDLPIVLTEAANGKEALYILVSTPIDIVLLDVQMPVLSGIETMKAINKLKIKTSVICLTQFEEASLIIYMVRLGAKGYLLKNCDTTELKEAIINVVNDGCFYSENILKIIQSNIANRTGILDLKITSREFQVMQLLREGHSNKEVAKALDITQRTAESYRKSLMKKTNCKNVAAMISLAYRSGLT